MIDLNAILQVYNLKELLHHLKILVKNELFIALFAHFWYDERGKKIYFCEGSRRSWGSKRRILL